MIEEEIKEKKSYIRRISKEEVVQKKKRLNCKEEKGEIEKFAIFRGRLVRTEEIAGVAAFR